MQSAEVTQRLLLPFLSAQTKKKIASVVFVTTILTTNHSELNFITFLLISSASKPLG